MSISVTIDGNHPVATKEASISNIPKLTTDAALEFMSSLNLSWQGTRSYRAWARRFGLPALAPESQMRKAVNGTEVLTTYYEDVELAGGKKSESITVKVSYTL